MSAAEARDPFKYFRVEARELCDALQRGALGLEKAAPSPDAAAALLRQAHTLKGAARIVRLPAVAELAHQVEAELEPLRRGQAPPLGLTGRLLALLDAIDAALASAGLAPAATTATATTAAAAPLRRGLLRLEAWELDEVMEGQREASARLAQLRRQALGLAHARSLAHGLAGAETAPAAWKAEAQALDAWLERFDRVSLAALDQAVRELESAHAEAGRMRLAPAADLFHFLERACHDAAEALGKPVTFTAAGGALRLDAPVLLALQEALQHVVRNAVVHGLEGAAARVAAGKPASGSVRVELSIAAKRAVFRCSDDGRGLDLGAIAEAARARGLLAPGAALSPAQAAALLLQGGLSTSPGLTELAGRGLGLDVLRATVERLKGSLELKDRPGQGLELRVEVPVLLAAYQVLEVEAGGVRLLIPFEAVRSAHPLNASGAWAQEDEAVVAQGGAWPLDSLFGGERRRPRAAVLIGGAGGLAALGVDRILGAREAVVQPLPELSPASRLAQGACLDAAGDPCLVLDPDALIAAARQRRDDQAGAGAGEPAPILVVDDSLTTRMLEQSILETAGYEVVLAASAEEGLACLRQRRYGLLLLDVEMPGMNGFELLELLKGEPALKGVPAILVSSCASAQDKSRGAAAGARDYIVKGEFDQRRLLARIRELML